MTVMPWTEQQPRWRPSRWGASFWPRDIGPSTLARCPITATADEELAKSVLYETIFAGTPYGHITAGHVKSLKSITLHDVRVFYVQHFTRNNLVVGLGGGYDAALLEKLCEDLARCRLEAITSPA